MKIAICAPLNLDLAGGVETHILEISQALRRLGQKVDTIGNTFNGEHLLFNNFQAEKYDIIHTHGSAFSCRFLSLAARRLSRQRHVHTLHGVSLDYLINCRDWLNWRGYTSTVIEGLFCRYADHVIAVSESIKKRAQRCFALKPRKISVIPNGYSPHFSAKNSRAHTRRQLGLATDEIVILFVGRGQDKVKGAAAVTAALKQLREKYPLIRLLAVPGSGFDDAEWLCRSGPIKHDKMPALYQAADIFVNASLNEGMPLTVIEALAAGLPVVASPVGGIPEIITPNKTGLLLRKDRRDLREQLTRLIDNGALRHRLSQPARQTVQPLTWDHLARQTVEVYESLKNKYPQGTKYL